MSSTQEPEDEDPFDGIEPFDKGPWKWQPPDAGAPHVQKWRSDTGYRCMVMRNYHGAWCGYVAIPAWHPFVRCNDYRYMHNSVSVHGGLTYVSDDANDKVRIVGFDCGHSFDRTPSDTPPGIASDSREYRDNVYVLLQTEALARQLREYESWTVNRLLNCGRGDVLDVIAKHKA